MIVPIRLNMFDLSSFLTAPTSSFAVDAGKPRSACGAVIRTDGVPVVHAVFPYNERGE
jgi:hypothetical protein